jgi:hypothetical protein
MLILEECWLAIPKEDNLGLVLVNAGVNEIGD